ncbi:helix-turn-helix domain-containing protein, partial [Streptomyces ipomoeae]
MLALRPGRTVPASALVDEVWAGDPPADASGVLQALVGRLCRALGSGAVESANGWLPALLWLARASALPRAEPPTVGPYPPPLWLPRYVFRGPARGPLASGPGMTFAPCRTDDLGGVV